MLHKDDLEYVKQRFVIAKDIMSSMVRDLDYLDQLDANCPPERSLSQHVAYMAVAYADALMEELYPGNKSPEAT